MRRWPRQLWLGVALSAVFLLAALVSLVWTPYSVEAMNIADRLKAPGDGYLLGTDHFGRDMLSMLMVGARTSIAVAIVAVGIGMVVGVPLGLLPRITTSSISDPRVAAANNSSGTPTTMPMPTATIATAIEVRAPTISIDSISRPK